MSPYRFGWTFGYIVGRAVGYTLIVGGLVTMIVALCWIFGVA